MPERPDLRKIAADIREALESYPPEALKDILTYVFQAYVVEGTPTIHPAQPERLQELEGLSFAEVIAALQTRLDLPELQLFEVNGGRVQVRAGGQAIPIVAPTGRGAAQPLEAAAPPAAPQPQERPPTPGVRVEEVPSSQLRPPPRSPAPPAEAPPPRRGLSVSTVGSRPDGGPPAARSGEPSGSRPDGGPPRPAAGAAPAGRPGAPGQPAQPGPARPGQPAQPAAEDEGSDSASKRFSLLDID